MEKFLHHYIPWNVITHPCPYFEIVNTVTTALKEHLVSNQSHVKNQNVDPKPFHVILDIWKLFFKYYPSNSILQWVVIELTIALHRRNDCKAGSSSYGS